MSEYVIVTFESHRTLFEAFEMISHDVGAGAGHENYSVPTEWATKLSAAEEALSTLTLEELETYCLGSDEEQAEVAAKSHEVQRAGELLEAFFNDFD